MVAAPTTPEERGAAVRRVGSGVRAMIRTARFLGILVVSAMAGGCYSVAEGGYVLCCMLPKYKMEQEPPPPPDTSTTHCEALAGAVYTAENGDRLAFDAANVRWTHGGTTETRSWRCETNRRVVLSGFDAEWKGTLRFLDDGMLRFHLQPFRIEGGGSTHVFPCERVPGRTYFAESGDSLAFLDARTVRWTTAAGARTLTWSCAPMEITLHDGTRRIAIVLPPNADLLRWDRAEWIHAPDGRRPPFPCDAIPGSTWRSESGSEVITFVGPREVRRTVSGQVYDYLWECQGTQLRLRKSPQDPGTPFSIHAGRLRMVGGPSYERVSP